MSKKNKISSIQNYQYYSKKSHGFCNTANYTANTCFTRSNIGQVIYGDLLVAFLQETCPFKVIESDICDNVFCEPLDFVRVQHLKCHQLLLKSIPCMNQRADIDNLLINVTCFAK